MIYQSHGINWSDSPTGFPVSVTYAWTHKPTGSNGVRTCSVIVKSDAAKLMDAWSNDLWDYRLI